MLETKKIPVSPRVRRMDAQAAPRLLPRPAPLPVAAPSRLARSEARLMGIAVTSAVVVCALIVIYLAAYAHVTLLGIDQARARVQLRQDQQRNETLRATRDYLQSPDRVAAAATALGMTTRGDTPVQYIVSGSSRDAVPANGNDSEPQQGINGGTTADIRTAASFDH